MVGVSLVTADSWIIAHFASRTAGAVSLMTYAKQLFTAPMAMLAQAAGAASMPFFASLWSQQRRYEFATGVADSVSRVTALGLLAGSAMVALAVPLVELLFMRGRFSLNDARECAAYFAVFSISLFLWSAQAIYSRAFLCRGKHLHSHGGGNIDYAGFAGPSTQRSIDSWSDGAGGCLRPGNRGADRDAGCAVAPAAPGLAGQPGLRGAGPVPAGCGWEAAQRF